MIDCRRPKECQRAADPFFKCFSEHHSVAATDAAGAHSSGDVENGGQETNKNNSSSSNATALLKCLREKRAYESCMLQLERKKGERTLYRVQEEYRVSK